MRALHKTTTCLALAVPLFWGCGDGNGDGNGNPDAAGNNIDAAVGADAAPQPGTCGFQVTGDLSILTEFGNVLFSNPDGSVLGMGPLDAAGAISRDDCPSGTIISVFADGSLAIYDGIQPGQTVVLDLPASPAPDIADAQVTVASPLPAGAAVSEINVGCQDEDGATGEAVTLTGLTEDCIGTTADTIDVLAYAADDNDEVTHFDWATEVPVVSPGPIVVNLDGWTAATALQLSLTNVPAFARAGASYSYHRNGVSYFESDVNGDIGEEINETVPGVPTDFGTALQFFGFVGYQDGSLQGFNRWEAAGATSSTFDSNNLLPRIRGVLVSSANPTRPEFQVVTDVAASEADFVHYFAGISAGEDGVQVSITSPNVTGTFVMPELPSDFDVSLDEESTVFQPTAILADADPGDYASLIQGGNLNGFFLIERILNLFPEGVNGRLSAFGFGRR